MPADLKLGYLMVQEIDKTTLMLCQSLSPCAKTEPDQRVVNAEAILMLQKDRALLVAELMTSAYGSNI
jgi:hypothetical protein